MSSSSRVAKHYTTSVAAVASVRLKLNTSTVTEGGTIRVCAVSNATSGACSVAFDFNVSLAISGTAGRHRLLCVFTTL